MSLYPPLTDANLRELTDAIRHLDPLRMAVSNSGLPIIERPGDEDELVTAVAEMRRRLAALDLGLFRIFGLVHRLKNSNVPTTLPQPRSKPRPTLDDLEGMM